jgi:hypothetical protein
MATDIRITPNVLEKVEHDESLDGDGTVDNPLTVVQNIVLDPTVVFALSIK